MGHLVPLRQCQPAAPPGAAPLPEPDIDRTAGGGRRIAVIGAGFSGVLVTLHLLWRCGRDDRVYLVERAPRFGQGLAYATGNPRHLLNVRVENMSALADEPDPPGGRAAGRRRAQLRRHLRAPPGLWRLHSASPGRLDHPAGWRSQPLSDPR